MLPVVDIIPVAAFLFVVFVLFFVCLFGFLFFFFFSCLILHFGFEDVALEDKKVLLFCISSNLLSCRLRFLKILDSVCNF